MPETLRQKQSRFVSSVGKLIEHAYAEGYEFTFGDAYRSAAQAAANAAAGTGITNSLHCVRLAVDLNLFRDGTFLPLSSDHQPLGTFWKSLGPDHFWGGDFSKPDGNHYSIGHEGRK